ncbi:MAG: rRNA maturation RNase YbeY [Aquificaceae bacterium]|nr:rRNA maturation RNase YbeY [Aquificaceae bacterium]MDW8294234.1 rRNA maturation RNase YbeY [Aquificaceae bacterium]
MKSLKGQRKNRVLIRKEKGKLKVRWLREIVSRLLELEGLQGVELNLYLTDDPTTRKLNREYRGKDKATDVLSFPFGEQAGGYRLLGEIVLSLDTAERQARELGHGLEEEIKRLVVHGFVHLLGYDHERGEEEERVFREKEERLLSYL